MGVLANDGRQLTYNYSSEFDLGRKVLGYVGHQEKKIRSVDIRSNRLLIRVFIQDRCV